MSLLLLNTWWLTAWCSTKPYQIKSPAITLGDRLLAGYLHRYCHSVRLSVREKSSVTMSELTYHHDPTRIIDFHKQEPRKTCISRLEWSDQMGSIIICTSTSLRSCIPGWCTLLHRVMSLHKLNISKDASKLSNCTGKSGKHNLHCREKIGTERYVSSFVPFKKRWLISFPWNIGAIHCTTVVWFSVCFVRWLWDDTFIAKLIGFSLRFLRSVRLPCTSMNLYCISWWRSIENPTNSFWGVEFYESTWRSSVKVKSLCIVSLSPFRDQSKLLLSRGYVIIRYFGHYGDLFSHHIPFHLLLSRKRTFVALLHSCPSCDLHD